MTLLHSAAAHDHAKVVVFCLEHGIKADALDRVSVHASTEISTDAIKYMCLLLILQSMYMYVLWSAPSKSYPHAAPYSLQNASLHIAWFRCNLAVQIANILALSLLGPSFCHGLLQLSNFRKSLPSFKKPHECVELMLASAFIAIVGNLLIFPSAARQCGPSLCCTSLFGSNSTCYPPAPQQWRLLELTEQRKVWRRLSLDQSITCKHSASFMAFPMQPCVCARQSAGWLDSQIAWNICTILLHCWIATCSHCCTCKNVQKLIPWQAKFQLVIIL